MAAKDAGKTFFTVKGDNFCKEAEYFVVSGGGVHRNLRKIFFDQRIELLSNRCLRKFESYMMGKTGAWYLRKNPVLFGP